MNLGEVANTDLGVVGGWLRTGLDWWLEELAGMIPERWRAAGRPRAALIARLEPGGGYSLWDRGEELEPWLPRPGARRNVALALPRSQVLTRELDFPLLPLRDVRRMAALELERLTPFRAEAIHFDLEVAARDVQAGKQRVRLGVVDRAVAADALTAAHALGLEPVAMGMAAEAETLRFDFLPFVRAEAAGGQPPARTGWWWGAAAGLAAANIALLVGRDAVDVGALRQAVEAQRGTVAVAMRLKQSVDREGQRRRTLVTRKVVDSPLRVMDAATRALPAGAWAQRFEWTGASLRLAGYRHEDIDVPAALEASPLFSQVRGAGADTQSPAGGAAANYTPFDVTATIKARPRS